MIPDNMLQTSIVRRHIRTLPIKVLAYGRDGPIYLELYALAVEFRTNNVDRKHIIATQLRPWWVERIRRRPNVEHPCIASEGNIGFYGSASDIEGARPINNVATRVSANVNSRLVLVNSDRFLVQHGYVDTVLVNEEQAEVLS